ncbi:hypothetical protein CK203_066976 [Vitis vinifera]|uniref:Uncharacterized protein n=1 Tax=Vitis vinifera TaxID=29760 RepID=A0A438F541_VITVI|nr:hypothetical protein CK203_066976 [Vitis vinifera]
MGTLTSVKVWKGLNKKVIGRCNLCSTKQGDLKKIMKSCIPKCRRWATLKVGNLKASEQPQDGLMRHFSPKTQSFPLEVRPKVTSIRCDVGPIGTSNARCRGKAKHGRNPRGLSRPFGRSNHVELDDIISTPFSPHIINYEPSRGFIVPKFTTYDGTSDLFDHIMHFRQLMTLDIGNDALLCHYQDVEYQDAGERVTQRLHETVWVSCAPSGVLQHGSHPGNL